MAEKINISALKFDTYSDSTVKAFSEKLAATDNTLGAGSASSAVGAMAAASALRAVRVSDAGENVAADLETLRSYMAFLIDEEVKAKDPLIKRLADNADDSEIEGGYRTACTIISEQLYTLVKVMELLDSVSDDLCPCAASDACSAVFYARAAMDSIRVQLAAYSTKMNEEVYARTTRREPEMVLEQYGPMMDALVKKLEAKLQ